MKIPEMKIQVVNVRRYKLEHPLPYIYVGRTMKGRYSGFLTGHRLANPFRPASKLAADRAWCIEQYAKWLRELPELQPLLNCLATEIVASRIPRLGCWCAPEPCHADLLAELLQPIVDRILTPSRPDHAAANPQRNE